MYLYIYICIYTFMCGRRLARRGVPLSQQPVTREVEASTEGR